MDQNQPTPVPLAPPAPEPCPTPTYDGTVAGKKIAYALAKIVLSFLASAKIAPWLKNLGIEVDPGTLQGPLTLAIFSGLVALHDWAKVKTGWTWL